MKEPAAVFLEAAGPLTILLAQCVYIGQPIFGRVGQANGWSHLANLLEDQDQSRAFAAFLREEGPDSRDR